MPQARSSGSGSGSTPTGDGGSASASAGRGAGSSSGGTKRSTASRSTRSSSAKSTGARSAGAAGAAGAGAAGAARGAAAGGADPRLEAAAERVRKLNERIIEAGKQAGELTLSSYERALKSIATTLEKGPGSSDVEWVSHLATTQAKFIRDVTNAWTSAAREMLK